MRNFEARYHAEYPTQGSAALNPRYEENSTKQGIIIAFPGSTEHAEQDALFQCAHLSHPQHAKPLDDNRCRHRMVSVAFSGVQRTMDTLMRSDFVSNVRYGSAQGISSNRMKRWQAVAVGCVFSFVALVTLFASL